MKTISENNVFQWRVGERRLLRWHRLVLVLCSLLLLGSCSTARLAYSNADTLAYWWLDGYVDVHSVQKAKVKRDIAQLLNWHRTTQLPQYVQTLGQMQTVLEAQPSTAELETIFRQVEQFSQTILLKMAPELTDFMLTMDAKQKAYLARKFEKNNEDYREKYLDLKPEKQAKERRKKIMKQADEWLGSVNREQELLVMRYLEKNPANYTQLLEDSMVRQRLALQLIEQIQTSKPPREQAELIVQRTLLSAFFPSDQSERRLQIEASRAEMQQLIVAILRVATPEQKAHVREKLQGWIDDCKYLIARK